VKFQVLTAASTTMTFGTLRRVVLRNFTDVSYALTHCPVYGESKHIWNVDKFPTDYTTQHPRRQ